MTIAQRPRRLGLTLKRQQQATWIRLQGTSLLQMSSLIRLNNAHMIKGTARGLKTSTISVLLNTRNTIVNLPFNNLSKKATRGLQVT